MAWAVILLDEVEEWLLNLDPETADLVVSAIDLLEDQGPTLGRPYVDRVKGSKIHNMKELRPGSTGTSEVRILFVFDPKRQAVLLVAGDKSGPGRPGLTRHFRSRRSGTRRTYKINKNNTMSAHGGRQM